MPQDGDKYTRVRARREERRAPIRRRMAPEDREKLIVEEATRYFAEYGLSGGTIELARRLSITQPLLYRYFPTKEALIEKVYENLFPSDMAPVWEALIDDQSTPLRNRLKTFYKEFAESVLTYEHVRLFLFSGLSRFDYNTRYYDMLTERIFKRIALALRRECPACNRSTKLPVSDDELEIVQTLHASIYHVGFRRWVHTPPLECDVDRLIEAKVDIFLDGSLARLDDLLRNRAVVRRSARRTGI